MSSLPNNAYCIPTLNTVNHFKYERQNTSEKLQKHVVWCFRLVTDSTSTGFSVAALDLGEVFQESGILYGLIALTGIFLFKNIILVIMYKMFVDFCMTQPPTFLLSYIPFISLHVTEEIKMRQRENS